MGLRKATDPNSQIDLCSIRQKDQREDVSDLKDKADLYSKQTSKWERKAANTDVMFMATLPAKGKGLKKVAACNN